MSVTSGSSPWEDGPRQPNASDSLFEEWAVCGSTTSSSEHSESPRRSADPAAREWPLHDDETACSTVAVTLPTHYNPALGQAVGRAIPAETIARIKSEICLVVDAFRCERVEQIAPPVLVTVVDGVWTDANMETDVGVDASMSASHTQYVDINALRIVANIPIREAASIAQRLLARAAVWAAELRQEALYVEFLHEGHQHHFVVRPTRQADSNADATKTHPHDAFQYARQVSQHPLDWLDERLRP